MALTPVQLITQACAMLSGQSPSANTGATTGLLLLKCFDDGWEKVHVNGQVLEISQKYFTMCHNRIDCGM